MAKEYKQSQKNREAYAALVPEEVGGLVPPQAVELEEAVLGALMLESDSVPTVQEYLSEDSFYTEEHRIIYHAINELSTVGKPVDIYTVTEYLKANRQLTKASLSVQRTASVLVSSKTSSSSLTGLYSQVKR